MPAELAHWPATMLGREWSPAEFVGGIVEGPVGQWEIVRGHHGGPSVFQMHNENDGTWHSEPKHWRAICPPCRVGELWECLRSMPGMMSGASDALWADWETGRLWIYPLNEPGHASGGFTIPPANHWLSCFAEYHTYVGKTCMAKVTASTLDAHLRDMQKFQCLQQYIAMHQEATE